MIEAELALDPDNSFLWDLLVELDDPLDQAA